MGSLTPLLDTAHSERSVTAPAFIMSKMQLRLLLNSRKKCSSHSVLFKECHVKKAMMSRTLRCILTNIHSHVASLNQSTYKLQKLFKEITFKCLFFFFKFEPCSLGQERGSARKAFPMKCEDSSSDPQNTQKPDRCGGLLECQQLGS